MAPQVAPPVTSLLSPNDFGAPVTSTVTSGSGAVVHATSGSATTTVTVPPGALPSGTVVSVYPVTDPAALADDVPKGQSYVLAFSVSWETPSGTAPNASQTITMTITDSSIKKGDVIYALEASGLVAVGKATEDGSAVVTFTSDPLFVVSAVPALTLSTKLGTAQGDALGFKVSCLDSTACHGTAKVEVARKRIEGKHMVTTHLVLASATVSIAKGGKRTLSMKLTPAGAALIGRRAHYTHYRMSLLVVLTGTTRSVSSVYLAGPVTIAR